MGIACSNSQFPVIDYTQIDQNVLINSVVVDLAAVWKFGVVVVFVV